MEPLRKPKEPRSHQRFKLVLRVKPFDLKNFGDHDVKLEKCPLIRVCLISWLSHFSKRSMIHFYLPKV